MSRNKGNYKDKRSSAEWKNDDKRPGSKGNRKSHNRGNNNNNKPRTKESGEMSYNKEALSSLNDISWYSRNPELLAAAARIPFPYKPGMRTPLGDHMFKVTAGQQGPVSKNFVIPGVMSINYINTVGYSTDVLSPVSIAAKELYGRVRSKFSSSLAVQAPDMMMFNLALDSIHSYISWLKRLYRALSTYSPYNRDYPRLLLHAILRNGDDAQFDVLRANKTRLWGMINELVHMANKFSVPDDMDLYHRHRWMCEHVYMDASIAESQTYIFNPVGFHEIDETHENGTSLKFKALSTTLEDVASVEYYFNYGLELIQKLSEWDDAYTINGYYERAFESANWYKADLLLADEIIKPVYVPEVLSQIENSKAYYVDHSTADITQDPNTNAVICVTNYSQSDNNIGVFPTDTTFVNLQSAAPTGVDVTIATRLTGTANFGNESITDPSYGTEIVESYQLYNFDRTTGEPNEAEFISGEIVTSRDSAADLKLRIALLSELSWYARKPMILLAYGGSATSAPTDANTGLYPFGDVGNFTPISRNALSELHRVCIYSEFNCFR